MRGRVIAGLLLVAAVVVVVLLASGGDESNGYRVRGVFDNGSFMVTGEQVRIAGANVGTIEKVAVSLPGEGDAYDSGGKLKAVPGKAIIVMNITDPAFQDFREDASCLIRPQSLIGERFVDCRPTKPRAPGEDPAPPLKKLPDGQPGAGEYLLPLGRSGTTVDPDLIQNIQTLPYAQRFRLILNELGVGLAGRGEDLNVAIRRANPVLRDLDTVFGELSDERQQLADLASNSEEILEPLAREKQHVTGFLANAGVAAQASSERGPELEAALQKFPLFLREFRQTMLSLKDFSDAGRPVLSELGRAAPSLTDATQTLTPFSESTEIALRSLGSAGEAAGPIFAASDPVVRRARDLARNGVQPTENLAKLFVSLKKTGGWDGLTTLIYNNTGALNGFDKYGHIGRTKLTLSNCLEYITAPGGTSSCDANFNGENALLPAETDARVLMALLRKKEAEINGGTTPGEGPAIGIGQAGSTERGRSEDQGEAGLGQSSRVAAGGTEPLLDYLLGP